MRRNGSISLGDAKIWHTLMERRAWMTNADIAKAAGVEASELVVLAILGLITAVIVICT
jgi:hypothetical protein